MNEKLKYLTLFVIGMMLSLGMNAQSVKSISGTVTDDQGEAVISGTVKVKNGSTGTITDINGKYTLSVPSNATLVFSYIGYITQEFKVSELKSNVLNVVLQSDTKALDEVVVVGYGTMRKSDLTGSISTAKGKDMLKAQSFNALDGLKGKVAGVNIFSNTGQPGGESRVIIRGISTINASASPLYVVDGVVMSNFELLNPNDIESIEVLKDASSAAIYGARGANGVIMVTTKRGNAGKGVHVSYDGSLSIGKMARKIDVMDANEWMSTFKQGLENANEFQGKNFTTDLSQIFTDERLFNADGSPKYNTNWQDEASRTAISHNHQISIQRTGEGSSIGAFINYTDQQGILLNSYFKRINAKLAYDDKPTDWLSTSVNLLVNHTWYWIKQGATTLHENWRTDVVIDNSYNHIMFGEIGAWLYKGLGGIQIDEKHPGFKHILLKPFFPADMNELTIRYNTPYGWLNINWVRQTNDCIRYTIDIPAGTSATFVPFTMPEPQKSITLQAGKHSLELDFIHQLINQR